MENNLAEQNIQERPLGVVGLGGWMVLVQIGIYGSLLLLLVQIFNYSIPSVSPEIWNNVTSKTSELYHPLWGALIIFELAFNVLFFLYTIIILINLYQKKLILPKLMIIYYSTSLVVGIIDYLLVLQIPMASEMQDAGQLKDIFRSLVTCLIWIPYFVKSERVKNTFVR